MREKRRLCFVARHYYKHAVGGAEVQMYLLGQLFIAEGWEVHYITCDKVVERDDKGIVLHSPGAGQDFMRRYEDFRDVAIKIDADVYYQRGRGVLTSFLGRFSCETGKPFVYAVSMQTDVVRWGTCTRIRWTRNPLKLVWRAFKAAQIDRLAISAIRTASLVLVQTEWQKQQLRNNLSIDSEIVRKVHDVLATQTQNEPPVVLWLANVKKWKQPEVFLRMAEALDNSACRFVMIGYLQDPSYKETIEDYNRRLQKFNYLGGVDYEESKRWIGRASVFVNTSVSESTPATFVQAWTQGVPVVTLHHDPDDIVTRNGLGFCSQTFDNLVRDVQRLIEDPILREKIGHRAKVFAAQSFDSEKNFNNLLKLIMQLV